MPPLPFVAAFLAFGSPERELFPGNLIRRNVERLALISFIQPTATKTRRIGFPIDPT